MRRAALPLFLSCLSVSACKRVDQPEDLEAPDADAGDTALTVEADDAPSSGEGRPLFAVPQLLPTDLGMWSFSPEQPWIAAPLSYGDCTDELCCGIWDIPSGAFITKVSIEPEDSPCETWPMSIDAALSRQRTLARKLAASPIVDEIEVSKIAGDDSEIPLTTFHCKGCEDVLALAWSPDGAHLAAVTRAPVAIEVWNIDQRKRVRHEPFAGGDPMAALIGWNDEGLVVVLEDETQVPAYGYDGCYDCDEDYEQPMVDVPALSIYRWPTGGGAMIERRHAAVEVSIMDVVSDPQLHWLFYFHEDMGDRSSSTELVSLSTGERGTGLHWLANNYSDYNSYYDESESSGYWRADLGTTWIEEFSDTTGGYDRRLSMGWGALAVEPEPAVYQQIVIDGASADEDLLELDLYAANAGAALLSWQHCQGEPSTCRGEQLAFADCEPIDGAPQLTLVLAECPGGLALVEPGVVGRRDRPGRVRAPLALRPDSEHRWGRGGWLALAEPGGRFVVLDPMTGAVGLERRDVDGFVEVALATQRGWLGLAVADRLELLDVSAGKIVARLPLPDGLAGLSPDGRKLAGIVAGELRIWSLVAEEIDGKPRQIGDLLASWPIADAIDVAWRQDGAALLAGIDMPERVIDARNGAELQSLLWTADLAYEAVDPSWRWIHLEDHEVVRLLDGRTLSYAPAGPSGDDGWARLDDGQFEGKPPALGDTRYRASEDPMAVPTLNFSQVERWLRHPNLVRDFFAGAPLPPARIPEGEYAKLIAQGDVPSPSPSPGAPSKNGS